MFGNLFEDLITDFGDPPGGVFGACEVDREVLGADGPGVRACQPEQGGKEGVFLRFPFVFGLGAVEGDIGQVGDGLDFVDEELGCGPVRPSGRMERAEEQRQHCKKF